jgi:ketosteroid isomerase-like protein
MTNASIARKYFQAITNGDIAGAVASFAPNAEFQGPMGPIPIPDGVRAFLQGWEESFPRARFEVTNTVESGDDVAAEGVWVGKHTGPLRLPDGRTLPPTNREVRAPFVTMFRVRDAKLVVHRAYWDMAGFMSQLTT